MWLPDADGGIATAPATVIDAIRSADTSLLAEWAN
jgi:hypothetical protein